MLFFDRVKLSDKQHFADQIAAKVCSAHVQMRRKCVLLETAALLLYALRFTSVTIMQLVTLPPIMNLSCCLILTICTTNWKLSEIFTERCQNQRRGLADLAIYLNQVTKKGERSCRGCLSDIICESSTLCSEVLFCGGLREFVVALLSMQEGGNKLN